MHVLLALLLFPLSTAEGISWRYEGIAGLKSAVSAAKKQGGLVMVGLAGSHT